MGIIKAIGKVIKGSIKNAASKTPGQAPSGSIASISKKIVPYEIKVLKVF